MRRFPFKLTIRLLMVLIFLPSSEKAQTASAAMLIYPLFDLTGAAIFLLGTRTVVSWSYGEEVGPKAGQGPNPRSDDITK